MASRGKKTAQMQVTTCSIEEPASIYRIEGNNPDSRGKESREGDTKSSDQ